MDKLFYDPETDRAYRVKVFSAFGVNYVPVKINNGRAKMGELTRHMSPIDWVEFRRSFIPVKRAKDLSRVRDEHTLKH